MTQQGMGMQQHEYSPHSMQATFPSASLTMVSATAEAPPPGPLWSTRSPAPWEAIARAGGESGEKEAVCDCAGGWGTRLVVGIRRGGRCVLWKEMAGLESKLATEMCRVEGSFSLLRTQEGNVEDGTASPADSLSGEV